MAPFMTKVTCEFVVEEMEVSPSCHSRVLQAGIQSFSEDGFPIRAFGNDISSGLLVIDYDSTDLNDDGEFSVLDIDAALRRNGNG